MEPKNELQRNAIAEARRKELEFFRRALDIQWLNSRMEDGRTGRCLALIEKEAEMEKDFQEKTDHAAIVNARAEEEARLGEQISKARDEEVSKLMRRHTLRERDPGLRELQRKLVAGYVCRDLKQQIQSNEYKRLQDKVEQSQANKVLLNSLYNDMEAAEIEERTKMEKNTQYCKYLQQQLVNKQRQKQCQYEDTLVEKKMQEGIMRTIADEDQRELQQKSEMQERMRKEMVTSQLARTSWRQKQKELGVIEDKNIEKQLQAASDRSTAIVEERERKMREREEQIEKIGRKMLADAALKQQREDIIKSLQEQEYLEQNALMDEAARAKAERYKAEANRDRDDLMRKHELAVAQMRRADAEFAKKTAEHMAMEEEKEREKERIKKQKNRQYFMDLQKQIEENASRRKAEKEMERLRDQRQFDHDAEWRAEVSHEREKIVEAHVPRLLGHLQAGVVKHEDLTAVTAGAARDTELATMDIGSLTTAVRPHRFPKCNDQCKILREY